MREVFPDWAHHFVDGLGFFSCYVNFARRIVGHLLSTVPRLLRAQRLAREITDPHNPLYQAADMMERRFMTVLSTELDKVGALLVHSVIKVPVFGWRGRLEGERLTPARALVADRAGGRGVNSHCSDLVFPVHRLTGSTTAVSASIRLSCRISRSS